MANESAKKYPYEVSILNNYVTTKDLQSEISETEKFNTEEEAVKFYKMQKNSILNY